MIECPDVFLRACMSVILTCTLFTDKNYSQTHTHTHTFICIIIVKWQTHSTIVNPSICFHSDSESESDFFVFFFALKCRQTQQQRQTIRQSVQPHRQTITYTCIKIFLFVFVLKDTHTLCYYNGIVGGASGCGISWDDAFFFGTGWVVTANAHIISCA